MQRTRASAPLSCFLCGRSPLMRGVRLLSLIGVVMSPAKQSDWKNEPMPASSKALDFSAVYTPEEFQKITDGLIPEAMEDKWFIYYDEPWLYLHRSWTGYCIYKVRFRECPAGFEVAEALVNREQSQYSETDDESDVRLLKILLESRAGRDVRQQMIEHIRRL